MFPNVPSSMISLNTLNKPIPLKSIRGGQENTKMPIFSVLHHKMQILYYTLLLAVWWNFDLVWNCSQLLELMLMSYFMVHTIELVYLISLNHRPAPFPSILMAPFNLWEFGNVSESSILISIASS